MPKPATVEPITLNSVIPHTKLQYRSLCRVRRCYGARLVPGTVLAKNGAWDRKAVISAVTYCGPIGKISLYDHGFVSHAFIVEITPLGRVYATGKFLPPVRGERPFERYIECGEVFSTHYGLGGWEAVEPVPHDLLVDEYGQANNTPPVLVPNTNAATFVPIAVRKENKLQAGLLVDPNAPGVQLAEVQQIIKGSKDGSE